ncbi:MAG: hypothetical protein EPN25_15120 [Nitrospirae bacterium]|nr:MAG: hypothetical protein EPN25_15120 [Nitrospirota bacterium]
MIKRLLVLTVVMIALSFGSVFAAQIDGLATLTGPALPAGLNVFINPSHLGDALVYPYYNVRDNKVTYFNIVNTDTANGVIVKLRFREAATIETTSATTGCATAVANFYGAAGTMIDCGSNEVLDFNVCLSAGDVYTGAIVTDTATGAGKFLELDSDTLTDPSVPASGVVFRFGAANPVKNITADNTREGYIEVLAFGMHSDALSTCNTTTGVDAPNRLGGMAFINDEDTAATYAYAATAIANCRSTVFAPSLANDTFVLDNCQNAAGVDDATLASAHVDQVDYPLTKVNIGGVYALDPVVSKGRTAMVITFPTKKLNDVLHDGRLFSNPTVIFEVWDDKENTITPTGDFSPQVVTTNTLPHEVNVLNIKNPAMFTSDVSGTIDTTTFNYGWLAIDLAGGASVATVGDGISDTYYGATTVNTLGLPGIGLVFQDAATEAISWSLPMAYATAVSLTGGAGSYTVSP